MIRTKRPRLWYRRTACLSRPEGDRVQQDRRSWRRCTQLCGTTAVDAKNLGRSRPHASIPSGSLAGFVGTRQVKVIEKIFGPTSGPSLFFSFSFTPCGWCHVDQAQPVAFSVATDPGYFTIWTAQWMGLDRNLLSLGDQNNYLHIPKKTQKTNAFFATKASINNP